MSRNGGKKRGAQPRQSGGGGSPRWLWLVGGVLLGWLMAFGIYLLDILPTAMQLRERNKAEQAACAEPAPKSKDDAAKGAAAAGSDKPVRIDFYTMLPNQPPVVPANGNRTTEATPPPVPTATPAPTPTPATDKQAVESGPRFLLQAGSFRTRAEAESRRATLTLSGFDVSVQEAKHADGATWFRVMVGPFVGEPAMERARQQLAARKIDTLSVRAK